MLKKLICTWFKWGAWGQPSVLMNWVWRPRKAHKPPPAKRGRGLRLWGAYLCYGLMLWCFVMGAYTPHLCTTPAHVNNHGPCAQPRSMCTTLVHVHNPGPCAQPRPMCTTPAHVHNHGPCAQPRPMCTTPVHVHNHGPCAQPRSVCTTTAHVHNPGQCAQPRSMCTIPAHVHNPGPSQTVLCFIPFHISTIWLHFIHWLNNY